MAGPGASPAPGTQAGLSAKLKAWPRPSLWGRLTTEGGSLQVCSVSPARGHSRGRPWTTCHSIWGAESHALYSLLQSPFLAALGLV